MGASIDRPERGCGGTTSPAGRAYRSAGARRDRLAVRAASACACLLILTLATPAPGRAQIDGEKRKLIQLGYNQPGEGQGPIAGYGFFYLNQPGFLRPDLTLRLAVAPVYLDSELGFGHALGPDTDLALGLAGGGFADSYSELREGRFRRGESFTGHGGGASVSVYHRFDPQSPVPLYGILRGAVHYSVYADGSKTSKTFELPEDRASFHVRSGLRWGGGGPVLLPALAMELSAWYEGQFRTEHGGYGFADDRTVEPASHLFWARALVAYTFPRLEHYCHLSLTAGTSIDADRFSAYRLGAVLPFMQEFPLNLPGYYYEEISARQFALLGGFYSLPLDAAKRWGALLYAMSAVVDYAPGLQQPGHSHSGVGGGITYKSSSGAWQVILGYGYGIDAIRDHGRGANSVAFLLQYDFEAVRRGAPSEFRPAVSPDTSRGLGEILNPDRIFGR
jgi:hypothetical protein